MTQPPASLRFFGTQCAELFSREIQESIQGALQNNLISEPTEQFPRGFVKASIPGHPWDDTCWTRDCGGFLREAALWGYLDEAVLISDYLLTHVTPNPDGFYTYPEHLKNAEQGSGTELDGTAAIVVGMVRLWQRLPTGHPMKARLYAFLSAPQSPIAYILAKLDQNPLVAGSGEFGGGWCVSGEWCNVVQNNLVRQALLAAAEVEAECGHSETAQSLRARAARLLDAIIRYLVDPADGSWTWCVDPQTLKLDPIVFSVPHNKATASINGASSCYPDAEGLEPLADGWPAVRQMAATVDKVHFNYPVRKDQYEKYGMCTFVDYDPAFALPGYATWLSYCDCFSAQTMLLLDQTGPLDKVLNWIAISTYMAGRPTAEAIRSLARGQAEIDFNRPADTFWFSERNFSPEYDGEFDLGCGKLNLVNVSEPMKLARLMLGIDDRYADCVRIVPRLPDSWTGLQASRWPVKTQAGVVHLDLTFARKTDGTFSLELKVEDGKSIPCLQVRFPDGTRKTLSLTNGERYCV